MDLATMAMTIGLVGGGVLLGARMTAKRFRAVEAVRREAARREANNRRRHAARMRATRHEMARTQRELMATQALIMQGARFVQGVQYGRQARRNINE